MTDYETDETEHQREGALGRQMQVAARAVNQHVIGHAAAKESALAARGDRRTAVLTAQADALEAVAATEASTNAVEDTYDRVGVIDHRPLTAAHLDADETRAVIADEEVEVEYDSVERRHSLAASLAEYVDDDAIEARLLADTGQATPPVEAVRSGPNAGSARRSSAGRSARLREQAQHR